MKFGIVSFRRWRDISETVEIPHIVIGYRTPYDTYPKIKFSASCRGHLELLVHDLVDPKFADLMSIFNKDHAKQILSLVEKNKDRVELIVCQCDAGISRSSATAAALSKILTGDDSWVFESPLYLPNILIYNTILNEYYEKDEQ